MEPQIKYGLSLYIGKFKALHKAFLGLLWRLCGPYESYHLVYIGNGHHKAFQYVLPALSCVKVKFRAAGDYIFLMPYVMAQYLLQAQRLGLAVGYGHHVNAEGYLKVGVFIKVLQYFFRVSILLYLYHRPHAHAVGLVPYLAYAGKQRLFFLAYVQYILKRLCLVHLIWHLGHDNELLAVLLLLYFGLGTNGYLSPARFVSIPDFVGFQYITPCRKIRTGHYLHQLVQGYFRIIHIHYGCVYGFAHIVGRYISRQTYGYA